MDLENILWNKPDTEESKECMIPFIWAIPRVGKFIHRMYNADLPNAMGGEMGNCLMSIIFVGMMKNFGV